MKFNFFKKAAQVNITSINLRWRGSTHTLEGMRVMGSEFNINIPFQNKRQEKFQFLDEYFKKQPVKPIRISKLTISEPFEFVSVSPTMPIEINENDKIAFKVKVKAPTYAYEGPLNVELVSDSEGNAHIEIPKIIVNNGSKHIEIKDKPIITDVPKGDVFKQNLHLYGIAEFGQRVNKIEIARPFNFIDSDPKLPFTIDKNTGFLIYLYIQAPEENYGGPLEINIS